GVARGLRGLAGARGEENGDESGRHSGGSSHKGRARNYGFQPMGNGGVSSAGGEAAEPVLSKWNCPLCTHVNELDSPRCDACYSRRPAKAKAAAEVKEAEGLRGLASRGGSRKRPRSAGRSRANAWGGGGQWE
ncbi:unnamed protein product, partial [Discosporangium mesarthrocarpum]